MCSSDLYVGAPSHRSGMGKGYGEFVDNHADLKPAVYVGANDGMLHAFEVKTGKEIFAYIPSWMGPKLGALTDPAYNRSGNHQCDGNRSTMALILHLPNCQTQRITSSS